MRGTQLFLGALLSLGLLALGCGDDGGSKAEGPPGDGDSGDGDTGDGDGDTGDGDTGDGDGDGDSGDGDTGDGDGDGDGDEHPCVADPYLCDPDLMPDSSFIAGPAPDDWICDESLYGDSTCDCGCGAEDFDCTEVLGISGCTEPGCVDERCNACFTAELTLRPGAPDGEGDWVCVDEGALEWKCDPARKDDATNTCDCGCGAPDPDCGGAGCFEAGCWRPACDRRHEKADPNDVGQRVQSGTSSPFAAGWDCAPSSFGDGTCDCGCGAPDPDCGLNKGCAGPLCNDPFCRVCHDADGREVVCSDDYQNAGLIFCPAWRLGERDGICDCGCGVQDPDCAGNGCSERACEADRCDRCTDVAGNVSGCAVPVGFTCGAEHYGTGDGCDCGCGVPDPDCDPGCVDDGCTVDSCDFCHDQAGSQPISCGNWTCDAAFFNEGLLDSCDCGCGEGDPDCRYGIVTDGFRPFCTEDGCEVGSCNRCRNGSDTPEACGGWDTARCPTHLLNNGKCDCGCGAIDPECEDGAGCDVPGGCGNDGCELCWNAQGNPMDCANWNCDPADFGDGTCDCGCGARDPDCAGGCIEPGCKDFPAGGQPSACVECHDYWGRTVECP